ncbi:MAG TPA: DUF4838 domain-containing protein [Gemmataceae bacterium]|nr:DUF4838 domain-containing protein [Gemmataceae bacterium]
MLPTSLLTVLALSAAPEPAAPVLLADGGRSSYRVVVHRGATAVERHAAEELAGFLREVSGATFPVEETAHVGTAPAHSILVGPQAAAGIIPPGDIGRLGSDGYVLRTRGPTLAIAGGRPRGTLYGVYSFLEDVLGCRWFTPGVARIPKRERLELRPLDRTFVPRLEYRATDYPDSRDAAWAARNKINGTQTRLDERRGGKVAYGPFVHTFDDILNPKDQFAEHPEFFSEVNGKRLGVRTQLCTTNPEVLRRATETVRRWMREQPDAIIFSVSQNDWSNFCTCPACAKVAAEEGSQIGPYLRFVNAIADSVRDEFPGRAIDTLAYQFTRQPPRLTRPRPNVIVRLCDIECCFAHPLDSRQDVEPRNAAFARDLRRWNEVCDRLYIWDYVINYRHSLAPFPNLYVLKPNIALFADNGVKGVYEEANYFSPGGEFAELRTWVVAKTLWDPGYDTDRAIDEFLDGYYEEAAGPIRRYIDLLHGKARMDGVHFRISEGPGSALFAEDILTRATALFEDAERRVANRPEVLRRVETAHLPILYLRVVRLAERVRKGEAGGDLQQLATLFPRLDRVARAAGVTHVSEQRAYGPWAEELKKLLDAARR